MDRIVSPSRSEFSKLRQPLTAGEMYVFDFFDTHLAPDWEIYIQPHLNGLKPDFVLLNPNVGIAVFEVKDWNLDALSYSIETRLNGAPKLLGSKDGKTFSMQKDNPIEKVYRYKKELFELYCPRLQQRAGFAVITAGVIFPFADEHRVKALFEESLRYRVPESFRKYSPLSGRNSLASGSLENVFPEGNRKYSLKMNAMLADDIRNWLVEPDSSLTQREPIELDANQKALVTSRTKSGYRRIKGAAGSGKSLVLAARAAELVSEGKQVLVVTFNITLIHYLMDIAVRWPNKTGNTRKQVVWLNFHSLCRRICEETDNEAGYIELWKQTENKQKVLSELLPALVERILSSDSDVKKFDAILVDEGQDFMPAWWNILRKMCRPGGEMLLVADATQDIYETASSWTDEAMKGAGFTGAWAELPISYRLPQEALKQASIFAEAYLPGKDTALPKRKQNSLELEPSTLRWVQTGEERAVATCVHETLALFSQATLNDMVISDATFLCGTKNFGFEFVKAIGGKGIKTIHTFDEIEQESRRQKVAFYMGDARVKATTLHSFKGWEARILVVYVGGQVNRKSLALIYAGLTRLKRSVNGSCLTVVSSIPELAAFGKGWQSFEDHTSASTFDI
jgi:hypothetical protein